MSELKAEIVSINLVEKIENSDTLYSIGVLGWRVVAKGLPGPNDTWLPPYKVGQLVCYLPVDTILDNKLESYLFAPDSKIKLTKSRIRSIKIRKAISQGMIVLQSELEELYPGIVKLKENDSIVEILNLTKYEPVVKDMPQQLKGKQKPKANPLFHKYTSIENLKNYPDVFTEGEPVYISEKVHGSSWRASRLPTHKDTWWKHVLSWFNLLPKYEFCYGSRNVQLQVSKNKKLIYYDTDIYSRIVNQLNIKQLLQPGEALYGEVYGPGIQANYTYGVPEGQLAFAAYDVQVDGKYLDTTDFINWCDIRGIPRVPLLYRGPFNLDIANKLRDGNSAIGNQKIKEGIVIASDKETVTHMGRKKLKYISDAYYLKEDNTDFH